MNKDKTIFEMQAEICKVLSSPMRIEILGALKDGEKTVTELVEILGTQKANVSQHLSVMRHKNILKSRRNGVNIYYAIANTKVIQACTLMKEVLAELLTERSKMAGMIRKA
ncbi:MAG: ArsR family transcriptional regulator [Nitrospirae bacterium]|nr:MAG: ArsR family transcriptional regulator [Nitrospirota bacterium]